tara:strand:+ start:141 stop:485 length:345 start_codon:yes stop_codon:yes gene_type:complete
MQELSSTEEFENRIGEIKNEIAKLGEIRTGSLTEQYNVCGKSSCKCKDPDNPQKHGPYSKLSYTRYRKSTSEFVRREDVDQLRQQLKDYKTFMSLKDEWIDRSIQLAKLRKASR